MKRYLICIVLLVLVLTLNAFAIEKGDYGYYDTTGDGEIGIVDVLQIIKQVVNCEDSGGILRAVQTLKLVSQGRVVYPTISEIKGETASLTLATKNENINFSLPIDKLGFDSSYDREFYLDAIVTMTASADFETTADINGIYAAKAQFRYDTVKVELSEGNVNVNGERITLATPPIMQNGVLLADYEFLANQLEAIATLDGTTVMFEDSYGNFATATVVGTYVPAKDIAQALGAAATFDEQTKELVFIKQFIPLIDVTEAIGKAGEEVAVTFSLSHNPGIAGLQINLSYDSSALSYQSAAMVSNGMYTSASQNAGTNPAKLVMANFNLKNVAGDITIGTVKFKIADDAQAGTYEIAYNKADIYDKEIYNLKVYTSPILITVIE